MSLAQDPTPTCLGESEREDRRASASEGCPEKPRPRNSLCALYSASCITPANPVVGLSPYSSGIRDRIWLVESSSTSTGFIRHVCHTPPMATKEHVNVFGLGPVTMPPAMAHARIEGFAIAGRASTCRFSALRSLNGVAWRLVAAGRRSFRR